ncbi:MAG TPA: pitrilysin family protein [Methylomirabilota bacterium]|nr:pitrilysin family protein [Methylomirabilota bacterium]
MQRLLLAVVLVGVSVAPVVAQAPSAGTAAVLATTLNNGLRVLLLEDHRSPIASVQLWYRVGSRNERPGATGIAHFLEHMMFKGTHRYGPRQFARLIEQNGGQDNAFTTQDLTSYFVNIAADKVGLVLELEADRMRNLLLEPKEINAEREVVIEERRTRTEDDPGSFLGEEVSSLAFKAHPYGAPIIGWMEDLKRITPAEIRAFYDVHYVPNNATLVVVGDIEAPAVLDQVKRQFGGIARGADPPPVVVTEPVQNGERRVIIQKQAKLPIVYLAWHVPSQKSPDAPALETLSVILSGGRASRLYRSLVYDRRLALEAGGDYSYFSLDPNLFWFWATPMPGQTPETLEQALLDEMEQLRSEPVAAEELARARNQVEASFVFQQDSVYRRAALLARFEMIGGYRLLDAYVDRIRAVTAADVQRVARMYFPADRKNVGVLLPLP